MRIYWVLIISIVGHFAFSQAPNQKETLITGVYQGKTLFIQNTFNGDAMRYCIDEISVNKRRINISYNTSAIKLDFDNIDLYTPVTIKISHKDTVCSPTIINPEAILFHTIFRFSSMELSDSAFFWTTKGERGRGKFTIEKLGGGIWIAQEMIDASGVYEGASYTYFPTLDEGANKYRIKYTFPAGSRVRHLYSWETDYDHYPEPIEFKPHSAKTRVYLSRAASYDIYDAGGDLVLTGQGTEIDVTVLRKGQYVIYFDGKDPGTFLKE